MSWCRRARRPRPRRSSPRRRRRSPPWSTAAGGAPGLIGIAKDTLEDLDRHLAKARDADIIVTIGGASVGDHDLVHKALSAQGVTLDFWKIAMRPGKPMMFGRKGRQRFIGLPGNPVSALICAEVFLLPLVPRLSGGVAETAMRRVALGARDRGQRSPQAFHARKARADCGWRRDRDGAPLAG